MAYLDDLIPDVQDPALAQQIYPWQRRQQPIAPPGYVTPQITAATPPAASAAPAQPIPANSAAMASGSMPTPRVPVSSMTPVAVGPTAAPATPPIVANQTQMQPVTLGTPPLPPAAAALAASKPPELHGWKKALDIVGQARFPGIESVIPGTPGNYRQQQRPLLERRAAEEQKNTSEQLAGQKDAAQIARDAAETANLNSEAAARTNPKAKNHPILINGPDGDPIPALQNMLTGEITDDTGAAIPNAKVWEKTPAAKDEKILGHSVAELKGEMTANPALYPGGWMDGAAGFKNQKAAAMALDKAKSTADRAPKDDIDKNDARMDRSYTLSTKELDKERTPLEATMQKISAGMTNLNLNSAQADAFLAPQILTLSAGGAGSGIRMNEAEINRILAGRTTWEALQAAANKYALDPQHAQIPPAQRAAMADILKAAQEKGTLKSSILEWADGALINADDVKSHREVVATARKMLAAVDEGKTVQQSNKGNWRIKPD